MVVEDGDDVTGLDFSEVSKEPVKGFHKILLIKGEGAAVKENDSITVDYSAPSGARATSRSTSRAAGEPTSFTLAKGSLIDGWVKGLVGVKAGSRVMLIIPPELGYGEQGSPPTSRVDRRWCSSIDVLGPGS